MNSTLRTVLWWLIVVFLVVALWRVVKAGERPPDELSFSEFLVQVDKGQVESVMIEGSNITGAFTGKGDTSPGQRFRTYAPDYPDLVKELRETNLWLQLATRLRLDESPDLGAATIVGNQLIAIFVASIKTARRNGEPPQS